jgi:hypothetical protein
MAGGAGFVLAGGRGDGSHHPPERTGGSTRFGVREVWESGKEGEILDFKF